MSIRSLCENYLQALNDGDLEKVLSLFSQDAIVKSPLYGERKASAFYKELFGDTARSVTQLVRIFDSSSSKDSVAIQFEYNWTLADGKVVVFECIDIFELTADRSRFKKLTIIYDTVNVREVHNRMKS